jgi:hypothetical protein
MREPSDPVRVPRGVALRHRIEAAGGVFGIRSEGGGPVQRGRFEAQPPAAVNDAWLSPQKVVSFFDEFAVVQQNRGEM